MRRFHRLRHWLFRHPFWHGACFDCLAPERQDESERVWAEIESDPETVAALRQGHEDIAAGRYVRWEDVKAGMET